MKYLFFITGLIISCTPTRNTRPKQADNMLTLINEGPWKTNFKNLVFTHVLYQMYGKEFASCCLSKDGSESANFDWLNYDSTFANKAIQISNEFMKRPYLNGSIEGVKVKMNYALEFRNSLELDSLTGAYYQQFQKDSIKKSKQ